MFKRNSSYFTFIVVGAVIIEGVFGAGMSTLWSGLNSGVSAPQFSLRLPYMTHTFYTHPCIADFFPHTIPLSHPAPVFLFLSSPAEDVQEHGE